MRESLAGRITGAYLALIVVVLLGLALYVAHFTRSAYRDQLEAQLAADAAVAGGEAGLALSGAPAGAPDALQALASRLGANGEARITLIAPDGGVLGDSAESPAQMDNHADRPEVAAALRGELGTVVRHSATVGYDMLYVAVPIRADGPLLGVARAALPLATVDQTIRALVGPLLAASGLAALWPRPGWRSGLAAPPSGRSSGSPCWPKPWLRVGSTPACGSPRGTRSASSASPSTGWPIASRRPSAPSRPSATAWRSSWRPWPTG